MPRSLKKARICASAASPARLAFSQRRPRLAWIYRALMVARTMAGMNKPSAQKSPGLGVSGTASRALRQAPGSPLVTYSAVIEEISTLIEAGRSVLVGTTSVEISELLSRCTSLLYFNMLEMFILGVLPVFSSL